MLTTNDRRSFFKTAFGSLAAVFGIGAAAKVAKDLPPIHDAVFNEVVRVVNQYDVRAQVEMDDHPGLPINIMVWQLKEDE